MQITPTVELSVIVVTYGAREITLQCLESVARESGSFACEVVVVDNGSPHGMAASIASAFPRIRVIAQAANSGFAAAANLASDVARGRYLLFLNPDTIVLGGALDTLLQFAYSRPGAGIWGGRTLFADGAINPTSCRRRPTLWSLFCSAFALDTRYPNSRFFNRFGYGGWPRDDERTVEVICGCFLLIDRRLWDRIAGFSPAFFMYGEDDDLCLRAQRLGFRPVFTAGSTIVHHGSGTETNQERKIRQILAARALLIRAHFSILTRIPAIALLALRPCFGREFAKPGLRNLWGKVWQRRRQWLAGRYSS